MDLMLQPLRKYADFEGRARRQEYWLFVLFQIFCYAAVLAIGVVVELTLGTGSATGDAAGQLAGILYLIVVLGMLVPSLAVSVRRMHDSDKTGWLVLVSLIPLVGGIIFLVLTVLDGTAGRNRYGPDPKGRGVDTPTLAETFS